MQGKSHSHRHDCEIGPSPDFQDPARAIEGHAGSHGYIRGRGSYARERYARLSWHGSILRTEHFFRPVYEYPAARLPPDEA
jgi:hypothetical protein